MIDPDFWTDEDVQALPSLGAELLYLGMISHSDDEGRFVWSARQLWAKVFPARTDVTLADVETWMREIQTAELVRVFSVDGRQYAAHPNWKKHQYVNKPTPSKIPCPPRGRSRSSSGSDSGSESLFDSVTLSGSPSGSGSVTRPVPLESESESESVMDSDSVLDISVVPNGPTANGHAKPEKIPDPPDGFPRTWPPLDEDLEPHRELARMFLVQFGNCTTPEAQDRRGKAYADVLAAFRSRGVTPSEAWQCCALAWIANGGKPLFGEHVKTALNYITGRTPRLARQT